MHLKIAIYFQVSSIIIQQDSMFPALSLSLFSFFFLYFLSSDLYVCLAFRIMKDVRYIECPSTQHEYCI